MHPPKAINVLKVVYLWHALGWIQDVVWMQEIKIKSIIIINTTVPVPNCFIYNQLMHELQSTISE